MFPQKLLQHLRRLIGKLIHKEMPTRQRRLGDLSTAGTPLRRNIKQLRHLPRRPIEHQRRALHLAPHIRRIDARGQR